MGENIVCRIIFRDCNDRLLDVLQYSDIKAGGIYIFCAAGGKLTEDAEGEFIKAFSNASDKNAYESLLAYADEGYPDIMPWYKPDFSPDTLESFFYIGNVFAVCAGTLKENWEDNISIYGLALKLSDIAKSNASGFIHIPKVLFINESNNENDKLPGFNTKVFDANTYVASNLEGIDKTVSVIIPSKDNSRVLETCLETLVKNTDYKKYEVIVVDNGSSDEEKAYVNRLKDNYGFKYIYGKYDFNFSKMCNIGAAAASAKHLLFLNDDIEIIEPDWLGKLVRASMKPHTGAVGAKLYYPKTKENENPLIQHVGITNMGIGPAHKLCRTQDCKNIYHGHNTANYNMLAVTGACMMIKREIFESLGGFDEEFAIAYNDVELCFRIYKAGFYNVVINNTSLVHHESLSRGEDTSPDKKKRLLEEKHKLYKKHPGMKAYDPFYSPNLVTWKWDSEYSENIIFEYDKEILPAKIAQSEIKRLPKEHKNKYIRKLTGENLVLLNIDGVDYIDSIENMYGKNMLLVRGWVALSGHDNSDKSCRKYLLLKSLSDDKTVYKIDIVPKPREDVKALFSDNTQNAENTGINVFFDESAIPAGEYLIGVLIENNRRFVKWSTETIKR